MDDGLNGVEHEIGGKVADERSDLFLILNEARQGAPVLGHSSFFFFLLPPMFGLRERKLGP